MSNTITNVLPKILAQGLMALRQNAVMARLVKNPTYDNAAQQRGNVINIPIPSAIAARDVTAAVSYAANVDCSPTVATVTLDQWKEAPFQLSDNDAVSVMDGYVPMQASEAIKSLGNSIDQYLIGKHTGIYGNAGTAGTTPFNASLTAAANAAKILNLQLANPDDRVAVIDPAAQANLVINTAVLNPFGPDQIATQGLLYGTIGQKLGFQWYMDQNITQYTPGTGWASGFIASTVAGLVGQTTLNVINATASGQVKVGDIFTVVGDTSLGGSPTQYVVTVTTTVSATVQSVITFQPPLAATVATGATLVVVSVVYTANLAFHPLAYGWASRPLSGLFQAGNVFQAPVDPVSGIALRVEASRQYKQETISYDILHGGSLIRPALASKIFG